jgi:diguanylate cyclase (GGDEF)-like protein
MMLKRDDNKVPAQAEETASSPVSPLLEPLLAVHNASDIPWLTDAAMTAAERGVGALYGFLYLGAESGGLRGEEPASRERIGALARVTQILGKDPTRLTIYPESCPAVAEALRNGKAVAAESLGSVLPFQPEEKQAVKAQRKLGVSEAWIVPIEANSETMGIFLLLMPENHSASMEAAEVLGRHVAVALANLREGDAARKRGELDAVRWIHDERKFIEELGIELQRSARHERPLSLLIVRVDDYGELVRRHGRFLAERALRRVAATMEEAMRATDFLGAYGEDGFAAILVEADETAAENARNRYQATLGKLDLSRANLPGLELHFSCVVATMKKGGSTPEELLGAAEQQLGVPTSGEEQVA